MASILEAILFYVGVFALGFALYYIDYFWGHK